MADKVFKGVSWIKEQQKWRSTVKHKGVHYHCGVYETPIEAAKARDKCIIKNGLKVPLQHFKSVQKTT